MVYAHLQLAQDKEARAVIEDMIATKGYPANYRTGFYAVAASQARYVVERGDWKGAAALKVEPTKFAYVDAITHFARALGAARSGDPDAAQADIAKLIELRDKLRQDKDAYWAEIVDIQRQVAAAWLLNAQGKHAEALDAMRAAADAEDKTEKSVVTPGPLAPARELYGTMLLERGMATEALAAFEATLRKEPNRFGATIGAAQAAEKAGDQAKARQHYAKVVEIARNGDPSRQELASARTFMAKN
jgi:tetratricopeptide (TPR) repeat protein